MKTLQRSIYLITFLMLTLSIGLLSCDGGGDDGGGGDGGGGGQPSGQNTTIRGNVESVVALAPQNIKPSKLAKIKDFFTLSKTANAQDNNPIVITFFVKDEEVDSVTVDPDGDFVGVVPISISGDNVTLEFESNGEVVSVVIFVPPVDAVIIVVLVNFQDDNIDIQDVEYEGPLRCENATISLVAENDEDIVIKGNGGPCILAGNCNFSAHAENVIFQDCGGCFDARGNSVLEVSAVEDITCDAAPGQCLIARGTSSVFLEAGDEIILSCIDARGTSEVILDATSCVVGEIVEVGNATVDTTHCGINGI